MPWDPVASVWFDDCLEAQPTRPRKRTDGATDRPLTLDFLSLFHHPFWPDSPGAPLRRVPTQRDGATDFEGGDPIPDAEPHSAMWPQQEPPVRRTRPGMAPPPLFSAELVEGFFGAGTIYADGSLLSPETATSGTAPGRTMRRSPPSVVDLPGRFLDFTWTDIAWPALAPEDPQPRRNRTADPAFPDHQTLTSYDAQALDPIPTAEADRMPQRPRPAGGAIDTPSEALAPQTRLRTFVVDAMPRGRSRQPQAGQEVIVSAQVLREAWPAVVEVIEGHTPRRDVRPSREGGADDPSAARMPVVMGTGQESGTGDAALLQPVEQATDLARRRPAVPDDLAQTPDGSWVLSEILSAVWHDEQAPRPIGRRPAQAGATVWVHFSRWTGPEMSDLQAAPPLPVRSRPTRLGAFGAGIDADLGAGPELVGWLQADPEQPQRARPGRSEPHAEPSWLGAGVIVVAGPYGAVAAEIYTAGAVAAVMSQEG